MKSGELNKHTMTQETTQKVNKFLKACKDADNTFDEAEWTKIKATIPEADKADAEAKVREELK